MDSIGDEKQTVTHSMNGPHPDAIFVDQGTTNTRVWLCRDTQILARSQAQVGVRDTARDGNATRLRQTLKKLIAEVTTRSDAAPRCVIAAGMITSSLGLAEVQHVRAPAGAADLAAATRRFEFPDVTPLPILLVPGVRTGELSGSPAEVARADIMRGEETLCIGLLKMQLAKKPGIVLNLGSHWKAIQIDEHGRIAASITSLSGEMIHAIQTTTILSSALPEERPESLDPVWLLAGLREQQQSGLPRAMFCVRLLEQSKICSPAERYAFLLGAFIGCDMEALHTKGFIAQGVPVSIVGHPSVVNGWQVAMGASSIQSTVIQESDAEAALLAGLRHILTETEGSAPLC